MPKASVNGIEIYYEVHGDGFPLVFSHEFAGDYRSWRPQVSFFARRYRVVVYNARGYPPSEVPTSARAYSQDRAIEDLRGSSERKLSGELSEGKRLPNVQREAKQHKITMVVAKLPSAGDPLLDKVEARVV